MAPKYNLSLSALVVNVPKGLHDAKVTQKPLKKKKPVNSQRVLRRRAGFCFRGCGYNDAGLRLKSPTTSLSVMQFHAMDTLHRHNYDLSSALSVLVPAGGPVLCRDEMEEWSASEAAMFEEALEKYGKDFNDIRQDFVSLPKYLSERDSVGGCQTCLGF